MSAQNPKARRRRLWLVIAATALAAAWVARLQAATPYFVSPGGSDTNDCLTLATACRHVAAALTKATGGDIVIIADGTYTENLTLDKDVTLIGFGQDVTTINGGGIERVLTVTADTSASVSNLTVANGASHAPLWTGGIYVSGTLRLAQSSVVGNGDAGIRNDGVFDGRQVRIALNFQGVYNKGVATLRDSTVENNGIGIRNQATMSISHSAVVSNSIWAFPGAGIANFGTMAVDYSLVSSNRVTDAPGAGIYNAGWLSLNRSLVISNTAYRFSGPGPNAPGYFSAWGGGIFNDGFPYGSMTIADSTLSGNSANNGGDQIENGGALLLRNVTMSGDDGHHGVEAGGLITLTNVTIANMPSGIAVWGSTVAYNTIVSAPCYFGTMTSLGHNTKAVTPAASPPPAT